MTSSSRNARFLTSNTTLSFDVDKLIRANMKERYEAYGIGIDHGFLVRNEAREKESMNPIDGLDEPLIPLNMGTAESLALDLKAKQKALEAPAESPDDDSENSESPDAETDTEDQKERDRHVLAQRGFMLEAVTRSAKLIGNIAAAAAKSPGSYIAKVDAIHTKHQPKIVEIVEPVGSSVAAIHGLPAEDAASISRAIAKDICDQGYRAMIEACECSEEDLSQSVKQSSVEFARSMRLLVDRLILNGVENDDAKTDDE